MNILVLIKQVPLGSASLNKDGLLDRSKTGVTINPYDLYALETAYQFKKQLKEQGVEVSVTCLTMGPEKASDVLRTAFSFGCDKGYLLCDRAFAGADVYSTAYTLKEGIKSLGEFDIIITGQQTTDGDTAQVPYSLAAQLNIRSIGWVKKVLDIKKDSIKVEQELSCSNQISTVSYPVLLSVGESVYKPHIPSLREQLLAKKKEVSILTINDLNDKDINHYGLNSSPTKVVKISQIEHTRKNDLITVNTYEEFKTLLENELHIDEEGE